MRHDLFISYSTQDLEAALEIRALLHIHGYNCWMAPHDVSPGKPWMEMIIEAIVESKALMLLLSAHSNSSGHVQKEVSIAGSRQIPVVGIMLEQIGPVQIISDNVDPKAWLSLDISTLGTDSQPLLDHVVKTVSVSKRKVTLKRRAKSSHLPAKPRVRSLIWNVALVVTIWAFIVGIPRYATTFGPPEAWISDFNQALQEQYGSMNPSEVSTIDLSYRDLKALSPSIVKFENVEYLKLLSNRFRSLPSLISQLRSLKYLNLSRNKIQALTPEIGELSLLDTLLVSNNELQALPEEIGQLASLRYLDASGNQLRKLPAEIGRLHHLRRLYLHHNQLQQLPSEIGQLREMRVLYLYSNQLQTLPSEIGRLQHLTELSPFWNQITHLPPEIGNLYNLTELNLGFNQLATFPPEIGNLKKLTNLTAYSNRIDSLPPEVGQLTLLKELDLDHNRLSSLPFQLGLLEQLEELDLSFNNLESLPPGISRMQRLRLLQINNNHLQSLLPEVGYLSNLETLRFGNEIEYMANNEIFVKGINAGILAPYQPLFLNRIATLPKEIGQLDKLKTLWAANLELTSLPEEIGQLRDLRTLDLGNDTLLVRSLQEALSKGLIDEKRFPFMNRLQSLPPEIGDLTNLEELFLANNQLTALPPSLGRLHRLQHLDLQGNNLTKIPEEVRSLHALETLNLTENPLSEAERARIIGLLPHVTITFAPDFEHVYDPWSQSLPLIQLTEVTSGEHRQQTFTINHPLRVVLHAVGEVSSFGSEQDYAFLVNHETGERIWQMSEEASRYAGVMTP